MPRKYQKKGKAKTFDVGSDWWMTKDAEGAKLGQELKTRYKVTGKTEDLVELTKIAKGDETFGGGTNTLTITMDDFNRQMVKNLAKPQQPKPTPVDPTLTYAFLAAKKGEGGKGREAKAKAVTQRHTATRKGIPVEQIRSASQVVGRWQEAASIFADQRRALDQLKRGAKADKAASVLQSLIRSKEEQEDFRRMKEEGPKSQLQKIEEAERAATTIGKTF